MQGLYDDVSFFLISYVNTLALKIAGIKIRIDSPIALERFNDFGFYKDFIVKDSSFFHCRLLHRIGAPQDALKARELFRTQNWQLLSSGNKMVLRVGPCNKRNKPDNVVVFDRGYREGVIYQQSVFELFRRFIDQFLIINLLSRNKGFLLHSSGVVWQNKGICFTGLSGTGKSTLLDLFKNEVASDCLLNDDRCALRNYGLRWRVFGTPWFGESRVSSSRGADLSAVFFIRHSKRNYVRRLSAPQLCPSLMVLGLLPLWDHRATARVLATFQNLIQNVPAFELGFVPGKAAVDLIKKTL
ncbi:MAG: hypothetical protein WC695_10205 [Candidatus Omnitrophota bacterium]